MIGPLKLQLAVLVPPVKHVQVAALVEAVVVILAVAHRLPGWVDVEREVRAVRETLVAESHCGDPF